MVQTVGLPEFWGVAMVGADILWVKPVLDRVVESVDDIPPMPIVANKATSIIDNPNSNIRDLASAISLDPSLASRVMRIANSAYYGVPRKVTSLQGAIVRVGFDVIKSIVFLVSAYGLLQKPLRGYGLASGELWNHSVTCAIAARLLAQLKGYEYPEETYICGLLHDVGKIALDPFLPEGFAGSFQEALSQGRHPVEIEAASLGFDHAILGGMVAEKWLLPSQVVEAIRCHHQPSAAGINPVLAHIVHAANLLATMPGSESLGQGADSNSHQAAMAALELPAAVMDDLTQELARQLADAVSFLAGDV